MTLITVGVGDSLREAFGDARPGDDIEIAPQRFTGVGGISTPSEVTIRAQGWQHGMSVLPSADRGLPVMIEGRLTIGASCDVYGIGVDSAKHNAAAGSVLIDGNENHVYDLWITNRSTANTGAIALTIGVPPAHGGRGPAHDFLLDGFQIVRFGTPGNDKHQGVYDKTTRGARVRNGLIRLGGRYGLHFYPDARDAIYERIIVDLCGAGLTFSSAIDSSTGVPGPRTRGVVVHHVCITRGTSGVNSLVESWWGNGNTPDVPCRLEDALVWRGGQPAGRISTANGGFTTARMLDADPGYRDSSRGDYTVPPTSPAADKVPVWLVDGAAPPPPPPPPPPALDTTPPTVAFVRPPEGAVLSGTFLGEVTATDASGIEWVEFRMVDASRGIDHLLIREVSPPYGGEGPFYVDSLPDGDYAFTATARDMAGNQTTIARPVVVRNLPEPPPPPPPTDDYEALYQAEVVAHAATRLERDAAREQVTRIRANVAASMQRHVSDIARDLEG